MPNGGKLTLEAANTYLDAAYCERNPELSPGQLRELRADGVTIDLNNAGTATRFLAASVLASPAPITVASTATIAITTNNSSNVNARVTLALPTCRSLLAGDSAGRPIKYPPPLQPR